MAILTAQQQSALDAWADAEPGPAGAFFAGLNQKLGPADDADDLIRRFQRAQPGLWNELITSLIARYSATQSDVEREVGRAVLGTSPQIQTFAPVEETGGEVERITGLYRQYQTLYRESQAKVSELESDLADAIALAQSEYQRGRSEAVAQVARGERAQQLYAALYNECQSTSGCEINVSREQGTTRAAQLLDVADALGIDYSRSQFGPILALVREARRIADTNVLFPTQNAINVAAQLVEA